MTKKEAITHLKERIYYFNMHGKSDRSEPLKVVLDLIESGDCTDFTGISEMGLDYNPPESKAHFYYIDDLEEPHPMTEEQKKKLKEHYNKCIIALNPVIPDKDKTVYYTKGIYKLLLQEQPWWKRKYLKWKSKRSFNKTMKLLK